MKTGLGLAMLGMALCASSAFAGQEILRCGLSTGEKTYDRLAVYEQDNGAYLFDAGGGCRTTHIPFTPELCNYDAGGVLEKKGELEFQGAEVRIYKEGQEKLVFIDEGRNMRIEFSLASCGR